MRVSIAADEGHDLRDIDDVGSDSSETTNVCSSIALFSALIGLFPPAIILGTIGFIETGRRENERGDGLAVVAVCLGILELGALILLLWRFQLIDIVHSDV